MQTRTLSNRLLDTLVLPEGLRTLSAKELERVAGELREELIDSVATSGGHFASSLGALEIALVLHHLFDTPQDRIVWDVGHQAYAHKMLTGRRALLPTIRRKGGISGFLKRGESEFDCFGAGHAGTAISAAVGMAIGLQRSDPGRKVVAVVGDAAIACGMAFEGLNHAGDLGLNNLIVVLNDNEMSISPNVGALSRLLSSALTSKTSTSLRVRLKNLYRGGYFPEVLYKAVDRAEEVTQGFFAGASMLFEALGFRYIGPIDGHNIPALISALEHAKRQDVPVLVHAHTTKGKGYRPAEQDPVTWHGVSPFNRGDGKFIPSKPLSGANRQTITYTQVFGETIAELALKDPKIVGITAAMAGGTGLDKLQAECPKSFFDVGICEEHAVTFAAGLACEGYRPVCAIYSTFLQRACDQIAHDVCLQNLPVLFAVDRAGLVGADGETHQGLYDISFLRSLPNLVIMSPKDENELRHMLHTGLQLNGPAVLRYPRGYATGVKVEEILRRLPVGKAEVIKQGREALFICFGPIIKQALKAAERLERENISVTIINARFAKPLDTALLSKQIPAHQIVCTLEDHSIAGGFGSAVLELVNEQGLVLQNPLKCFGVGNFYVPHATQEEQQRMCGLDAESLVSFVMQQIKPMRLVSGLLH